MDGRGTILIVDDEPFNVDYLEQELEDLGYATLSAGNGQAALDQVRAARPDLILLDIMMPILDGFAVLERLKADPATRDLPVIIISAMSDMRSVVRGIELGAEDYLPKPFDATLLRARLSSSLERKRYRDQEVEYLRQVARLTAAAQAMEAGAADSVDLGVVAGRPDALGQLARVFERMRREIHAREQRLRRQLEQLRLDQEERARAAQETAVVYIPMDRRQALAAGRTLPDRQAGTALLADVSGFTPLTEALALELGWQRGAEELIRQLNRVYGVLIELVHGYGGSVVSFSGDAIACWLNADAGERATACALAMQGAMGQFAALTTPAGRAIPLTIKVAVAAGRVRRLLVGDPGRQYLDALAGRLMDELSSGEQAARPGEVVVNAAAAAALAERLSVAEWRAAGQFAVVTGLAGEAAAPGWPALAATAIPEDQARAWLLPPIFEKVQSGNSQLLSELRPAAMLFGRFGGLDYDGDDQAGQKLDAFIRWVEQVVDRHEGALLQLTVGDKGSYFYSAFGVPVAHGDDAARALAAALELRARPAELSEITGVQIGLTYGQVRAGAYGGPAQRTYGALGDKTNLAARLMMRAASGEILCDAAICEAAQGQFEFEPLPPIQVKGKGLPVAVYRPRNSTRAPGSASLVNRAAERALLIDRLSPADQQTLKAASVLGPTFSVEALLAIQPAAGRQADLLEQLEALALFDLLTPLTPEPAAVYGFKDPLTHQVAYNLMLFAQRRELHRAAAEWYARTPAGDPAEHYALLAHHWRQAEDLAQAGRCLEQAGAEARAAGDLQAAAAYLSEALALETQRPVLSPDYYARA